MSRTLTHPFSFVASLPLSLCAVRVYCLFSEVNLIKIRDNMEFPLFVYFKAYVFFLQCFIESALGMHESWQKQQWWKFNLQCESRSHNNMKRRKKSMKQLDCLKNSIPIKSNEFVNDVVFLYRKSVFYALTRPQPWIYTHSLAPIPIGHFNCARRFIIHCLYRLYSSAAYLYYGLSFIQLKDPIKISSPLHKFFSSRASF